MATFPTPSQIFAQFKTILKTLRPDLNTDDASSDVIIRGRVFAGVISGAIGDQKAVDDDTFIQDARIEALEKKGADLNFPRQPATKSTTSDILLTGTIGSPVPAGTTMRYLPTGITYKTVALVTLDGSGNGHASLLCDVTGQIGNVSVGNPLSFDAPPPGVNTTGTLVAALADGSDIESVDSYRSRLLNRVQQPPAGGNQYDYPNFAFAADPSVRSARITRFGRGLGTVDIYITTGTTDVDSAIDQGIPVVRIPGAGVIATVQAYYSANAPLTDSARVFAPSELAVPVTVKVDLLPGVLLSTVPVDPVNNPLGLTVSALISREISRVLYKIVVGGRKLPGYTNGFVVAADIETQLDKELSGVVDASSGLYFGKIPVLVDRQAQNLDGGNVNKTLLPNQLAAPGTITIIEGV
jgi:uncharacterized phage protein gp47/JayE